MESSGPQIDFGRTPCLASVAYFKELDQRLPSTVSEQHTRKRVTHTIFVLSGSPEASARSALTCNSGNVASLYL